jgi:hypothetical protein
MANGKWQNSNGLKFVISKIPNHLPFELCHLPFELRLPSQERDLGLI